MEAEMDKNKFVGISAVLGHRDIKTTMTYLDSLSQNVLDRVAMLL